MTGLVMEGGAMRGMFTCGVIDIFLENDIRFDGAAGISAGATFGCNFKSRQIGRPVRYNKRYGRDPRYCSIRSLITTGDLYGAEFCYHELPDKLDVFDRKTFQENPMPFYIGATDVETGEVAFHRCTDGGAEDIEWMRASASMPGVSNVVMIDGRGYLDGGIADPIPYAFMEEQGYDRNVMILTQAAGYRKKKSGALTMMKMLLRKYPKILETMEKRHVIYNRQLAEIREREEAGTALVIRPPEPLHMKRTENDPEELERVYQIGRKEALRRLPEVRAFLDADRPGT